MIRYLNVLPHAGLSMQIKIVLKIHELYKYMYM